MMVPKDDRLSKFFRTAYGIALVCAFAALIPAQCEPIHSEKYFAVQVVDAQTGRGVPLVELKTVSNVRYYSDSAGLVAIDDPAFMGRTIFFTVSGHGYEYPVDGL